MLKIVYASHTNQKLSHLQDFNPERSTWITSDLYSKSQVQNILLEKSQCLPEDAVIRISELWHKIFYRSFSDIEVASRQFISTLLSEWLKKRELAWARHPGTANLLLDYIGEFLPLLSSSMSTQRMREWLREHPESFLKWGHWFELSVEAWDHFRKEKILASTWVSAYLNCSEWSPNVWQRELYIDVSADFIGLEIELLQKLAQHIDVTVFAPEEKWIEQYPTTLWPYQVLAGKKIEFSKSEQNSGLNIANANCKRFSTQISEVKSAIAQIRTWLNEGCSPGQLAVVAADIEAYWPALEAYAQREGIPVAKDMVLAAASLPNLGRWISRLKIESQDIESATLEQALYTDQSEPMYGFEKFKQLFSRIYDESDLKRDSHLRELFKFKYSGADKLKRDEFLAWALQYWQGESVGLENLSALFLNECPVHIKLELRSWISYLVGLIAKVEVKIKEGDASGIYCVNFDSAQNLNMNKCILLGLSDSDLQQAAKINLSQNEVQMIGQDLGFYLESPDQQQNSFLAHYLATQVKDEVSLYFSATSFAGEALGPSLFWLQNALKSKDDLEKIDLPQMTRWDELQMSDIQTMGHEGLRENLEIEMGVREFQQIAELPPLRFSATQIEKYLSCPFIFLTEKLFHLSDFPEVDLDLDAMSNGRLMHAVLERVLAPQLTLNRTPQDLANLIDEMRIALAITVGDERLWASKRNQYLRMVTQFLEFEKNWRRDFPHFETIGREVGVRGELQLSDAVRIQVSGKIDRVDTDGSEYVVLDYKSTAFGLHNYGSWLENNELQLIFYALALEQGLTELPQREVVAAFYYVLASLNREKGFRLDGRGKNFFDVQKKTRTTIDFDKYSALMTEAKSKIIQVVENIQRGQFAPAPLDIKDCQNCNWRSLCRAPHLQ